MKAKRIAAFAVSLAMIVLMIAAPMSAGADPYMPVGGGEVSFGKYLVMDNEASVPCVSFGFTVEPISAAETQPATADLPPVLQGPAGIKFKPGTGLTVTDATADDPASVIAAFTSSDATTAETGAGDKSVRFNTAGTDDEKFAEKTITLDLSDVSFPEPGIYRYRISETPTAGAAGITDDADSVRYLDVFVQNDDSGGDDNLVVASYSVYKLEGDPGDESSVKSTGFSNAYGTNDLQISKAVTGSQGSTDKYFKITVRLTNPDDLAVSDDDMFVLSGNWDKEPVQNAATTYTAADMAAANNKTSITYGDLKGDEGYSFYIHDGQSVTIQGIPSGLGYVVSETEEEYTPSVVMDTNGDTKTGDKTGEGTDIVTSANNTVTDSFLKSDAGVVFTNDKSGDTPTGILSTVNTSAAIVAVGLVGIVLGAIYLRKKKNEEE